MSNVILLTVQKLKTFVSVPTNMSDDNVITAIENQQNTRLWDFVGSENYSALLEMASNPSGDFVKFLPYVQRLLAYYTAIEIFSTFINEENQGAYDKKAQFYMRSITVAERAYLYQANELSIYEPKEDGKYTNEEDKVTAAPFIFPRDYENSGC